MGNEEEMYGYYGVVVPDRRFHASPLCPYLRTIKGWKQAEVNNYPREADAIIMGHLTRCPVCFNMYRFRIRRGSGTTEILLHKSDMKALLAMATLSRRQASITVTDIGAISGLEFVKANDTIKRLRRLRLVAAAEFNSGAQVRGKRRFTELGRAVVAAYEANLCARPSDEEDAPVPEANTRLIK